MRASNFNGLTKPRLVGSSRLCCFCNRQEILNLVELGRGGNQLVGELLFAYETSLIEPGSAVSGTEPQS